MAACPGASFFYFKEFMKCQPWNQDDNIAFCVCDVDCGEVEGAVVEGIPPVFVVC